MYATYSKKLRCYLENNFILLFCIIIFVLFSSYAILNDSYLFITAHDRLVRLLSTQELSGAFLHRKWSNLFEQIGTYIALSQGVESLTWLRRIWGANYYFAFVLSWVASYYFLSKENKKLILLPVLSFFIIDITCALEISSEAHFLHAMSWPVFFFTFYSKEVSWPKTLLVTLLCIALSQSYESVIFFSAVVLCLVLYIRFWKKDEFGVSHIYSSALLSLVLIDNLYFLFTTSKVGGTRYEVLLSRIIDKFSIGFLFPFLTIVLLVCLLLAVRYHRLAKKRYFVCVISLLTLLGLLENVLPPLYLEHYRIYRHSVAWAPPLIMVFVFFFQKELLLQNNRYWQIACIIIVISQTLLGVTSVSKFSILLNNLTYAVSSYQGIISPKNIGEIKKRPVRISYGSTSVLMSEDSHVRCIVFPDRYVNNKDFLKKSSRVLYVKNNRFFIFDEKIKSVLLK